MKLINNKGLLIVLSGPSGSGKGTICKEFMNRNKNAMLSVSATTRAPREGEVEGESYYFMSEEAFMEKIQENGFLEHACFCGNYYGTPKDAVINNINNGKDVILEIEVQGAMNIRAHYPEAVFVFVVPPTKEILKSRLEGRHTETQEVIEKRIETAKFELGFVNKYNYLIINDEVENAVNNLESIIKAEKSRIARNIEFLNEVF